MTKVKKSKNEMETIRATMPLLKVKKARFSAI
jgi:hypothetical protein